MEDIYSIAKLLEKTSAELEKVYDEALKKLPSRAPIYLPTERISLPDRIIGVEHVRKIYDEDLDAIYRPKLRALREEYKNRRRCFLIGNGPSLNRTDLSVLKDEVTFAVNGFFLKAHDLDWKPTFYVIEDHLVAEDRAHWVNKFKGPTKLYPAYLGYVFSAREDTIFYNHRPRKSYPHGFDFSLEADKITYTGCTVTFSMMQIAAYFGFEEIYLIGVDASYDIPADAQEGKDYAVGVLDMKSDDPNHFDPNYFGKGFRWHDPQVEKMVEAYGEARRALEKTSQRIYNATVGGMLEVFERRDFNSLFPNARQPEQVERDNEELKCKKYPRLLILDMTAMGNGSATGDLKANLFEGWPSERFLQIARSGKDGLATVKISDDGSYLTKPEVEAYCWQAVQDFEPDVILYRPVPKVPWLHDFSMRVIEAQRKPLVTWLMDDWPAEVEGTNAEEWSRLGPDLTSLLNRAALNLSICDKMSESFRRRYGVHFQAYANGVNPVQWPALKHHEEKRLKIRYSGGLAQNMTLASVLRVARAVEQLATNGTPISLEISTQSWWLRDHGHHFSSFKHTQIDVANRDPEEYRLWLSEADAVLIAYNFDEETMRYVRYSMANKMPECLASGAAIICHGPVEVATIDYLKRERVASISAAADQFELERLLLNLCNNPSYRNFLARKARKLAFDQHNIVELRQSLRALISSVNADYNSADRVDEISGDSRKENEISARSFLISVSGRILMSPSEGAEILALQRADIEKAVSIVPPEDGVRQHFEKVRMYVLNSIQSE